MTDTAAPPPETPGEVDVENSDTSSRAPDVETRSEEPEKPSSIDDAWEAFQQSEGADDGEDDGEESASAPDRDEKGRFKKADAPDDAETNPAPKGGDPEDAKAEASASPPLTLDIKIDGQSETLDFAKMLADDASRTRLKDTIEKGRAFDTVVERREKNARVDGIREFAEHVRKAGYDLKHIPATLTEPERVEVTRRGEAATPTPKAEPEETASPATDERRRTELMSMMGTEEWPKALAELIRLEANEVAAPLRKELEATRSSLKAREEKEAQERQRQAQEHAQANFWKGVDEHIGTYLGGFPEGARGNLQNLARQAAIAHTQTNAQATVQSVHDEVTRMFENLRSLGLAATTPPTNGTPKQDAPAASPQRSPLPPPVGSGSSFSSGGSVGEFAGIKSLDDDAGWAEAFRS